MTSLYQSLGGRSIALFFKLVDIIHGVQQKRDLLNGALFVVAFIKIVATIAFPFRTAEKTILDLPGCFHVSLLLQLEFLKNRIVENGSKLLDVLMRDSFVTDDRMNFNSVFVQLIDNIHKISH